jgi:hypothetical protein
MSTTLTLATALVTASGLMVLFAGFRRIMRSPSLPAIMDNIAFAYGSALLITGIFMSSMMFVGFAVMPFIHSASLSFVTTLLVHLGFWSVARIMIPLGNQKQVVGHSILAGIGVSSTGVAAQ